MAQLGRCILLTGAPAAEDLNWEEKNLHSHFDKGSRTSSHARTDDSQQVESSWQAPKWRALATTPERAQRSREPPQTQFFSFSDQLPELDIATKQDFLEHSIALIDDLVSSQIAPHRCGRNHIPQLNDILLRFRHISSDLRCIRTLQIAHKTTAPQQPTPNRHQANPTGLAHPLHLAANYDDQPPLRRHLCLTATKCEAATPRRHDGDLGPRTRRRYPRRLQRQLLATASRLAALSRRGKGRLASHAAEPASWRCGFHDERCTERLACCRVWTEFGTALGEEQYAGV